MRVILFTCVVLVHTVNALNDQASRPIGLLTLLMHFTRYGFVAITVFVLFLGYYHRDVTARTFWRKRFGLVVLPYLVWSAIYTVWGAAVLPGAWPGFPRVAHDVVLEILKGDAKYQMYFLLISMQIYLFFPLLRRLLRRTAGHHGLLLAAAAAVQLAVFCWLTLAPPPRNPVLGLLYVHAWKALPTYALLVVIGALAAVHAERLRAWLTRHAGLVLAMGATGAAVTVAVYLAQTGAGVVPPYATPATTPTVLPWVLGAIAMLYLAALAWDARRGDGRGPGARLVAFGSHRAFGIFAVHPLVIDTVLLLGGGNWLAALFPASALLRSAVLVVVVFGLSLALVEVLLRTPLAKVLVARPRIVRQPDRTTPA